MHRLVDIWLAFESSKLRTVGNGGIPMVMGKISQCDRKQETWDRDRCKLLYSNAHPPLPGTHLHVSTPQAGPEITERDARPSLIRTLVPFNNRSDSRRRQRWTYAVDIVARGALHRSRTARALPHFPLVNHRSKNGRRSMNKRH